MLGMYVYMLARYLVGNQKKNRVDGLIDKIRNEEKRTGEKEKE